MRTTDGASAQGALAWLKQEREQVDPAQGKLTLAELCDRYSATSRSTTQRAFATAFPVLPVLLLASRVASEQPSGETYYDAGGPDGHGGWNSMFSNSNANQTDYARRMRGQTYEAEPQPQQLDPTFAQKIRRYSKQV